MHVPSKNTLIGVRKMSTRRYTESEIFRQAENALFNKSCWNQNDEPEIEEAEEDDEPSDDEMMSAFGTKWHDGL